MTVPGTTKRSVMCSISIVKIAGIALLSVFISSCTLFNGSSSNVVIQEPPILPSAMELYHDGKRGIWIEENDVANLMLWINSVRDAAGR